MIDGGCELGDCFPRGFWLFNGNIEEIRGKCPKSVISNTKFIIINAELGTGNAQSLRTVPEISELPAGCLSLHDDFRVGYLDSRWSGLLCDSEVHFAARHVVGSA